jgi:hypothetical protein
MTTLLTNDNLAKMKNAQAQNLPETAYIQGLSTTNSASGWSESWTTKATVNARLGEPKGEMEKSIAATITSKRVWTITLPADTALEDTDQIQINSVNYRVHWSNKGKSNITALRVVVTEA